MQALLDILRLKDRRKARVTALEIFKYIGPGLLVTVGFIDPGNWASNLAAGSGFGYGLLWVVTLSTLMLIVLQHNAAHLGIATGLCLSEAGAKHLPKPLARFALYTAVGAAMSTALAELLGAAIALRMLFGLPLQLGAVLTLSVVLWLLLSRGYRRIERYIIGLVSLIGVSFVFELYLIDVNWLEAGKGFITPQLPEGSIALVMSVLGAVVMPHNLFLHSEVIQSRKWNLENDEMIRKQLKYEFLDTLLSMICGFAINAAMVILAAATFFKTGQNVDALEQAGELLKPLLGNTASLVFALALLLSGLSSSITAGMAGGSIFAGIYGEPYDVRDSHSRLGLLLTLVPACLLIFVISDPYQGLIVSQIALSIQLPVTILMQVYLTSSRKVMGKYVNPGSTKLVLGLIAAVVIGLNLALLASFL